MNFNLKDIVELDRRTPRHVANSILRGGKGTVSALHIDGVTVTFWKESLAFPTAKRELRFSYGVNTVRPTKYLNNTSVSLATEVQKLPRLRLPYTKVLEYGISTSLLERRQEATCCAPIRMGYYGHASYCTQYMDPNLRDVTPDQFNYDFREGDEVVMRCHENSLIPQPGATGVITFHNSGGVMSPYFTHNFGYSRRFVGVDLYSSSRGGYASKIHPSLLRVTKRGPEPKPPMVYDATLDLLTMNLSVPPNRSALLQRESPIIPLLVLQAGTSDTKGESITIKVNAGYGMEDLVLELDPEAAVALITTLAEALA